ncbi:MAG: prolipoprotein diacylglyceryl transferase [Candidatus Woesearchaeota archaeon]
MIYNNLDPVLFSIGPLSVRYYGLAYAIGLIATYLFLKHMASTRKEIVFNKRDVDDMFIYIMLGMIIGGRIGYVLIYNPSFYLTQPLAILEMWRGGMSFHGGVAGVVLGILLYTRGHNKKAGKTIKKKIGAYDITDLLTIPAGFSLALGRLANFTNHELYGRITDVPWAVKFKGVDGFRHPSQIYEALYSVALGGIQWFLLTHGLAKGMLTWSFIVLYGAFRFITEFFRQPDLQMGDGGFFFGWMTTGQILSIVMILVGGFMVRSIYIQSMKEYE